MFKASSLTSPLLALILLHISSSNLIVAELASGQNLSQGWRFTTGDNLDWSKTEFDDSNWQRIETNQAWETQGHEDYDGYAWYRLRFIADDSLNKPKEKSANRPLLLKIGQIDDVDQTWFNGVRIGTTGGFPDNYDPAWMDERAYTIPATLIQWNSKNVIAVRVYDGTGDGGLVAGKCELTLLQLSDLLAIDFEFEPSDGIFTDANSTEVIVALNNNSDSELIGRLKWSFENDEFKQLFEKSKHVSLSANSPKRIHLDFNPPEPGFYRIKASFQQKDQKPSVSASVVLGFRPTEIAAPLTRKPDFDHFWNRTLQELKAIDPRFKLTRIPARDSKTHEVYEITMHSHKGIRVGGWYERPKVSGIYPAVLRVPGYGQNMQPTGRSEAMVYFSFNVRGHGNSQTDVKGTPQDFWIRGLDHPRGYYYQGAYADCVRAVDFLVQQTEVDPKRIGVTGGSQGGGLSFATAALDSRISLCAPDIPFLCDWKKYFKTSHWPEVDQWIAAESHRSWGSTLETMGYFDILNMVDRIHCPVFVGLGLQDEVCPPATIFSVYNRITSSKSLRVYPRAKHWVPSAHTEERYQWISAHFGVSALEVSDQKPTKSD